MEEIAQALKGISKFDQRLGKFYERFDSVLMELNDLSQEFEGVAEEAEYDPERIMEAQQRLDLIYRLENKHQANSVEELLQIQQGLQEQVDAIGDLSAEIAVLEKETARQEEELLGLAEELSRRRHAVVGGFENEVERMLAQLAMEHARIKAEFTRMEELGPTGFDEVNFLFAANLGSRMQLIKDVASGGELSRLTLVVKSLVASAIPLPTLIFDEIDTGISGDVALKMGNILRKLSNEHQVISITHSPQIASKADVHYFVYKRIKDVRTITEVRMLELEERIHAIATMLSQSPPSDSAIANARELLKAG